MSVSGNTYRWIKNENGEKLYDCKLTENNLKIYVDKEYATSTMISMMDEFGDVLRDAISGTDSKEAAERELKIAKKRLEEAKQDLERAKRNMNRKK